jgi:GT2 family glycosyltransferase
MNTTANAIRADIDTLADLPSNDPTTVTVVICCYTMDRCEDLAHGLASLVWQTHTPEQIVVVVDHNDELFEWASAFATAVPLEVEVIRNVGQQGLSGARNTGVEAATGTVVAFLDDDAAAGDDLWVEKMLDHYRDGLVWGVGGAARPDWGRTGAPGWFPEEFGWVVGCTYRGQPTEVAQVRNFLGCNMSFRRDAFAAIGGFTEGIGRVGTNPVGCEETELCTRLRQAHPDAQLVYDPDVWVRHRVSADRTRFRYFRSRCLAEGRSKSQVSAEVGADDALTTERSYATRVLPLGVARGVVAIGRGDRSGPARAAAILVGLALTTFGYVTGRVRDRLG